MTYGPLGTENGFLGNCGDNVGAARLWPVVAAETPSIASLFFGEGVRISKVLPLKGQDVAKICLGSFLPLLQKLPLDSFVILRNAAIQC